MCSDSQEALKALQTARMYQLVQQCQKALNDISTRHAVGLYCVPESAGIRGNEIVGNLAWSGQKFVGPEPALGVSRRNIRRNIRHWLVNQHWKRRRGLVNNQRQAREFIPGPYRVAKIRLLSCKRT
jgi:hypothetical protein